MEVSDALTSLLKEKHYFEHKEVRTQSGGRKFYIEKTSKEKKIKKCTYE